MSAFGTGTRAMQGSLFVYAPGRQAFVTGSLQKKAAVLLGGLSDGLLACPYAPPLAEALEALGYATVQPILRTSYAQFGFGSLDNDVEDLEALFACEAFRGVEEVFLVGHSTGSQICAHYARHGKAAKKLSVCLQGGVSDRETDSEQEVVRRSPILTRAQWQVDTGKGAEFLPRECHWAPMTARRYLDLHDVGGADDYFSSDLADDEMRKRFSAFGAKGVGCLVAYSGADEYAPKSVDKPKLVEKICGACAAGNAARVAGLVVAGAPHNCAGAEEAFVAACVAFLTGGAVEGACFDTLK